MSHTTTYSKVRLTPVLTRFVDKVTQGRVIYLIHTFLIKEILFKTDQFIKSSEKLFHHYYSKQYLGRSGVGVIRKVSLAMSNGERHSVHYWGERGSCPIWTGGVFLGRGCPSSSYFLYWNARFQKFCIGKIIPMVFPKQNTKFYICIDNYFADAFLFDSMASCPRFLEKKKLFSQILIIFFSNYWCVHRTVKILGCNYIILLKRAVIRVLMFTFHIDQLDN